MVQSIFQWLGDKNPNRVKEDCTFESSYSWPPVLVREFSGNNQYSSVNQSQPENNGDRDLWQRRLSGKSVTATAAPFNAKSCVTPSWSNVPLSVGHATRLVGSPRKMSPADITATTTRVPTPPDASRLIAPRPPASRPQVISYYTRAHPISFDRVGLFLSKFLEIW